MKYLSSLRRQGSLYQLVRAAKWIPACAGMTMAVITLLLNKPAHAEESMPITAIHKTLAAQTGWLNTSRPLTANDLQGRIILLDFWTYCCINCMHVIPDLKYLEETFGHDLTVIGVHSAKFKNERDTENIKNAILRYGIEHPVVNDFDFSIWNKFGVRAWPTFVLINPKGTIEQVYSGEGNRGNVERDVEKLREKYAGQLITTPLPIALEKDKTRESVLSFPGKLAAGFRPFLSKDEVYDGPATPVLFVSDTGHHRIVLMEADGTILQIIGSGQEGYKDGDFATAQLRRPQGVLYDKKNERLYIADTENHALRVADLRNKTVSTLAGTGKQGFERQTNNKPALETPLASPWDLAFYPDENHIAIAMAGTHQLWTYDINKQTVSVLAGNGRESIDDGNYPYNSLSQPSGLSVTDGKLYFVDSETSSLRVYEDRKIETLIGTGLFDFGLKDGVQGEALMQHALGVFADDKNIFVADSYNHAIRRYDVEKKRLYTFAGNGQRGTKDGQPMAAQFNEPNDIQKIGNTLYVADTNNHAIRTIDLTTGNVATLTLKEHEPSSDQPRFSRNLPNAMRTPPQQVQAKVRVVIDLASGWHINKDAPSYLALFDTTHLQSTDAPTAFVSFDTKALRNAPIALPALTAGQHYHLQGTLYYCEDKEGAQCLIKSFNLPLSVDDDGKEDIRLTLR